MNDGQTNNEGPVCVLDDGGGVAGEEVLDRVAVRGMDLLRLSILVHPNKKKNFIMIKERVM